MSTVAPPTSAASEPQARPKVLRRPAQFSRKADPLVSDAAPISTPAAPSLSPVPVSTARSIVKFAPGWQDDGRFGVAIIFCLVLFNVVLAFTLSHTPRETVSSGPSTVTLMNNASMPSAVRHGPDSGVTVYSEPRTPGEGSSMDLEELSDEHNDFSVSPNDIPAPTARALDE